MCGANRKSSSNLSRNGTRIASLCLSDGDSSLKLRWNCSCCISRSTGFSHLHVSTNSRNLLYVTWALSMYINLPEMGRLEIRNMTPTAANTIMPMKRTYIELCMFIAALRIDSYLLDTYLKPWSSLINTMLRYIIFSKQEEAHISN